jgi:hypothetical protein
MLDWVPDQREVIAELAADHFVGRRDDEVAGRLVH